ncbi:MAG: sodium:solute symporter family protein [Victivallales bacterium]|nr:sodium:solute symporter family protein [Victivallales bacterium]
MLYLGGLIIVGFKDARSLRGFSDYVVAGRCQGMTAVVMSILATIIGASTTIGIVDTAYRIGFPAVWWLLWGSVGLLAQSLTIASRFRAFHADTMPDVARITVGRGAETLLALLICVAWIGVIAGQFAALSRIISFLLGTDSRATFLLVSAIVIGYTSLGGQLSVVRTDMVQLPVILSGIVLCCLYLYLCGGAVQPPRVELLNDAYGYGDLAKQFFVIGGVYFLGPDILSRSLIAKDGRTARHAVMVASGVLVVFAAVIVLIGVWAKQFAPEAGQGGTGVLLHVLGNCIPRPLGIILSLAIVSALLSSVDTCLINAASIFSKDILRRESVSCVRASVAGIGVLALVFTLCNRGDIIAMLTGAYSIYAPGVICPMLIAVLCHGKHPLRRGGWFAAVVLGGLCGLLGTYCKEAFSPAITCNLPMVGMALSLIVSLASVHWKTDKQAESYKMR